MRRKKRRAAATVGIILDKLTWKQLRERIESLELSVIAARDLVLHLTQLLNKKKRQSEAGHKAAATRLADLPPNGEGKVS